MGGWEEILICYASMQNIIYIFLKKKNIKDLDNDLCKDINAKYVFGLNFEKIEDLLPQGVDFHCFPGIIKDIKEDTNYKYSDEQIKNCIWEFNSKINKRKDTSIDEKDFPKLKDIWDNINKALTKYQLIILEAMLQKLKEN